MDTRFYRKPCASGRLVNFQSAHSLQLKTNLAKSFIHRVVELTTIEDEIWMTNVCRTTLLKNGYPASLIKKMWQETVRNHQQVELEGTINQAEEVTYRSMMLIPGLSQRLAKIVTRANPKVKVSYKPLVTNRSLFSMLKSERSLLQSSNVIYAIPCKDCPPTVQYIGKTTQLLQQRMNQHSRESSNLAKLLENRDRSACHQQKIDNLTKKTALQAHAFEYKHSFDIDKVTVKARSQNATKLANLEMLHIIDDKKSVNFRRDTDYLSTAYSSILKQCKEKGLKK